MKMDDGKNLKGGIVLRPVSSRATVEEMDERVLYFVEKKVCGVADGVRCS